MVPRPREERGAGVAGRGRAVMEPAAVRGGEGADGHGGEFRGRLEPGHLPGGLVQRNEAAGDGGVVLEHAVPSRAARSPRAGEGVDRQPVPRRDHLVVAVGADTISAGREEGRPRSLERVPQLRDGRAMACRELVHGNRDVQHVGALERPGFPHSPVFGREASPAHMQAWDPSPELAARVVALRPLIEGDTRLQ